MPKLTTPFTDIQARTAKAKTKTQAYTLADGRGMYLEVAPSGSKISRMSYRQPNGKNTRLTFGSYPDVTLAGAREQRDAARKQRSLGADPAQAKRSIKTGKGAMRLVHNEFPDSWRVDAQTSREENSESFAGLTRHL